MLVIFVDQWQWDKLWDFIGPCLGKLQTVAVVQFSFQQKQLPVVFYKKSCSWKNYKIRRKTLVLESLFHYEMDLDTSVFLWILGNF